MLIVIPKAPNQVVPNEVEASIKEQTVQWPYISIDGDSPSVAERNERIKAIVITRNKCLDKLSGYSLGLMHDSDCIFRLKDTIQVMWDFLTVNKDFLAVAGRKFDYPQGAEMEPDHVLCSSWLIRGSLFSSLNLRFRYTEGGQCECRNMCEDIRKLGYRVGYVDGLQRINDLHLI